MLPFTEKSAHSVENSHVCYGRIEVSKQERLRTALTLEAGFDARFSPLVDVRDRQKESRAAPDSPSSLSRNFYQVLSSGRCSAGCDRGSCAFLSRRRSVVHRRKIGIWLRPQRQQRRPRYGCVPRGVDSVVRHADAFPAAPTAPSAMRMRPPRRQVNLAPRRKSGHFTSLQFRFSWLEYNGANGRAARRVVAPCQTIATTKGRRDG